ncbi:MAG: ABC transporter permease, partial [Halothermotrichaceae bacterium]
FLVKLAFKNLFRHKLRTFVSIIAIAFAVMVVVFARGYVVGMVDSFFADHIQYNSGHIKIIKENYQQQQRLLPLNYPVDGFRGEGLNNMTEKLQEIEDVKMVIPRLKFGAVVSRGNELITMSGWGVNLDKEKNFTDIENYLTEGRMFHPGQLEVVMGSELLNKINYQLGDKVTILTNTSFGSLKGVTFKIVGKIESGIKMLNEAVFYLPLDQAQRILYMDDQATELLLVTPDRSMANQVLPAVNRVMEDSGAADEYLALSYKETSDLVPFMEMGKLIYNQIYIFLVLLASIVVINTMIMIVKERTREIGMMSALGLEKKNILQLFIIEGGIMGIIGSFIGALTGGIINSYLAQHGIDFRSALSGFSSDIVFNSIIYPEASTFNTIFAFVIGVVIVSIACIIPARRAAKLEPTEAMREE